MTDWRKHILFFSIIAMMVSLFLSRFVLSASMVFFIGVCFFHRDIKGHIKNFLSSPLLWSMTLLFLLPLLSGLWSEDKKEWLNILRIKLPLLLLPLAFAAPFSFSKRQWQWLGFIFIIIITTGSIWSMFHYASNMSVVHKGYLQARTILTPLENDHVRFSWLITVAVLVAAWLWWQTKKQKSISILLGLVIAWLIVFLHILAARTGLLSFYIVLLATILRIIFKKGKLWYGTVALATLVALPVLAYFIFPTFHNKVKYFNYDFEYFKDAHYLPGGNDASRVISLKAGWQLMNNHPAIGVGFGDVLTETKKWYEAYYPQMLPADKILPSSEWLMYGVGCGMAGLLIFTFVMGVPFFIRVKNKWSWWLLNVIAAFGFLFDIGLEVQFGVFIYAFIVLTSWKWFRSEA